MTRGALYEYAGIFHPRTKKDKAGEEIVERSKCIIPVTSVVASSPDEVQIIAARAIPEDYLDKLDQVEIIVRPFGQAWSK